MKNSKLSILATVVVIFGYFIGGDDDQNYSDDYSFDSEYYENDDYNSNNQSTSTKEVTSKRLSKSSNNPKVEYKTIKNPKTGEVAGYVPLPKNWKINGASISGPNNIEAQEYEMKLFNSVQKRPMSAMQILKLVIEPPMKNHGAKIINTQALPQIMKKDAEYIAQLHGSQNYNKSFDAIGVDIQNADGSKTYLIIRQLNFDYGTGGNWGYTTSTLNCNKSVYNKAKETYLYALANSKSDKQQIANYNRNEANKESRSWATHNAKMRNNQRNFDNWNRTHVETSNAISDMSMQTWRNNNASQDRIQNSSVNGIHETTDIYDPSSGQSYNVQDGYDRYFTNGQGDVMGTNDQFYQPGSDLNLQGEWNEYNGGN